MDKKEMLNTINDVDELVDRWNVLYDEYFGSDENE